MEATHAGVGGTQDHWVPLEKEEGRDSGQASLLWFPWEKNDTAG